MNKQLWSEWLERSQTLEMFQVKAGWLFIRNLLKGFLKEDNETRRLEDAF